MTNKSHDVLVVFIVVFLLVDGNYVMFDRSRQQANGHINNGYPPMNGGPGWNKHNGNIHSPQEAPPQYNDCVDPHDNRPKRKSNKGEMIDLN